MPSTTIWDQVLSRIEDQVGRHSFSTWFKPTTLLVDAGQSLSIRVPNLLFVEWLPKHYSVVLAQAMREVGRPDAKLVFVPDGAGGAGGGGGGNPSGLPYIAATQGNPEGLPPQVEGLPPQVKVTSSEPEPLRVGGLIPRYTFDTFIVGPSNQFAHAACRAVAETPSRSYNPLFIHGGVGLGKTHLMHAIGHYVVQHHPGLVLTYISSERFMNEMINAVRFDRILDFRSRYRSVDVLLVDDIQFVSGKEGTQNEFFHTFNALHDAQKQIVISSDRPPHEIPALEERLRSRFEWGLIADIQSPDLETKVAILKKKAEGEALQLPDHVAMYMATRIKSNIRELEGSLIRLIAYASLTSKPLTIELAHDVLRNVIDHDEKAVTIEQIQKFVAEYYQMKPAEIRSRNNSKSVAMPRQIAMYLCKALTHASLPEIGRSFGGKHHSTVIHSIKKVEEMRKKTPEFDQQVKNLLDQFK
ncbi:MAG: chromosomal replication initiator protein DnaA [Acidobacteriota bacterium]|nr:chromosomal replication initiator protein DnaA [Acidobacteriota bacterium]